MEHSNELLANMNSKIFLTELLGYLLSNNLNRDNIELVITRKNAYNYSESLNIIFKLCYLLPNLGFSDEECENFRNKLRLYTKYFNYNRNINKLDSLNNASYVKIKH